jgi:hypothetical protein
MGADVRPKRHNPGGVQIWSVWYCDWAMLFRYGVVQRVKCWVGMHDWFAGVGGPYCPICNKNIENMEGLHEET